MHARKGGDTTRIEEMAMKLTGFAAVEFAEKEGYKLNKAAELCKRSPRPIDIEPS
jgi:hypothetical protein